jgi:hypothetical protein
MLKEDEESEKLKMQLIFKDAKELSQKNMINHIIEGEEYFKLNFEHIIFLRYFIQNRCPITREKLYNQAEKIAIELKKIKGIEIKLEPAGNEVLLCLIKQEISVINTPEDSFPELANLVNSLSKINVYD